MATVCHRPHAPFSHQLQRLLSATRRRGRRGHDVPPERQKISAAAAAAAVAGLRVRGDISRRNRPVQRLPVAAAGSWCVQLPPVFSGVKHSGK